MTRRSIARHLVALGCACAIAACEYGSPVSPKAAPRPGGRSISTQAIAGSYELAFYRFGAAGLEPVTSLPILSDELILGAHIADQFGANAQRGTVVFQYCSRKGLPPNDFDRADEAPSASCMDGSASWANLGSAPVDASGNAYWNFGVVRVPRVVGFRCRYMAQGGAVASGVCAPKDFTWT